MVGEDIYVAAGEEIDEVVCIGCSIRIDGKVKEAVAVAGSIEVNGEVSARCRCHLRRNARSTARWAGTPWSWAAACISIGKVRGDAVTVLGGLQLGRAAEIGGDTVAVLGGINGKDCRESWAAECTTAAPADFRRVRRRCAGAVHRRVSSLLALWPFITFVTVTILGGQRVETIQQTGGAASRHEFLARDRGVGGLHHRSGHDVLGAGCGDAGGLSFFVVAAVGYAGLGLWVGRGMIRSERRDGAGGAGGRSDRLHPTHPVAGAGSSGGLGRSLVS